MRVVLQRVTRAEVRVDDEVVGRIGRGYLLLAAFSGSDTDETLEWMAAKIPALRLFPESDIDRGESPPVTARGAGGARPERGSSFARSLIDIEGEILLVSQFTLYADASRGRRPSFSSAAPPELAIPLYERFAAVLRERAPGRVETGRFGAMMEVELVNDGPVTLVLER